MAYSQWSQDARYSYHNVEEGIQKHLSFPLNVLLYFKKKKS